MEGERAASKPQQHDLPAPLVVPEVPQAMGTLSNSSLGDHMRGVRCTWAARGSSRFATEEDLLLLWSWDTLCYLFPFEGPISPFSGASCCLFLLSSGFGFSPRSAGSWGRGGGGFTGGLDLLASCGVDTLFLPFISSLKLWLDFGAISSTSLSEESST